MLKNPKYSGHLHPETCLVLEAPYSRSVMGGFGRPAASWETPFSPTEMLSDSEEDQVSSNTNSYDYGESSARAQLGSGNQGSSGMGPRNEAANSLTSHCTSAELWAEFPCSSPRLWAFLSSQGLWGRVGGLVPATDTCPSPVAHAGEEYRPLLFYQETTAQILVQALNPLDYRKWRNKSAYWRALKVFKVRGGGTSGARLHASTGQWPLSPLQS